MAASPVGFTSPSLDSGHCTANDIRIATADVLEYSFDGVNFITFDPNSPISCTENDPIFLNIRAHVLETATSQRTDIGVWIAQDGGNARTGLCNHYNLVNGVAGVSDLDSDSCGDMENANEVLVPLGIIDAVCQASATSADSLHIGSCLGWTQPGGDATCPLPGFSGPTGFRYATVPGTSSKCNCEGFNVPITVNKFAKIQINKVCDPVSDPGTFDLNIDGSTSDAVGTFGDNKACGTNTGLRTVSAGTNSNPGATHSISETDFTTANYNSSYACTKNGNAYIGSTSGTGPFDVTVQPNDQVICTFVNARKPQVKLVKDLDPDADAGRFDLTIGATTYDNGGAGYADQGNTGFVNVAVGSVTISEAAHTGTSLSDYVSTLSCVKQGAVSVTVNPNNNTSGTISAAAGDQITCTFLNKRKPEVKLVKDLDPDADAGRFDLTIAGTTFNNGGAGYGDLGNTGFQKVAIGPVNISEAAHTGTSLSDYTTTLSCDNGKTVNPNNNTSGTINVVAGDRITCTFVNTKGATLKLVKTLDPTTDGGTFDFTIGATSFTNGGAGYGHNGTTNFQPVPLGSVSFSELAHSGTSLADYISTVSCDNGKTVSNNTGVAGTITVAAGDQVTCTFVNVRKPQVKLVKDLDPDADAGRFDLTIGATTYDNGGAGYGDQGNTGFVNVAIGSVTIAEAAHTGTSLTDYVSTLSCVKQGAVSVTVNPNNNTSGTISAAAGDQITCTFLNKRKPEVKLVKDLVPDADAGRFDLTIGATTFDNGGAGYADGGNTGFQKVAIGSVGISEAAHSGTAIGDYISTVSCDNGKTVSNNTGVAGTISVAAGDKITCTFVNTRRPQLKLVKMLDPTNDGGKFDFTIAGNLFTNSGSGYGHTQNTGFVNVAIGSVSFNESGHTGTTLSEYTSTLACDNKTPSPNGGTSGTIIMAAGEQTTCTFTNKHAPKLGLAKTPDPGGAGYMVSPGQTATFTITLTDSLGGGPALNAAIVDTLPAGVGDWSMNPNQTECTITALSGETDKRLLSCNSTNGLPTPNELVQLNPGTSFTVVVQATVPNDFLLLPPSNVGASPLEIDGNLLDDAAVPGKDWATIGIDCLSTPKQGCDIDKPTGATDDSFGQGTSEDTPVPTVVSGSIPNNKSDLLRFYVANERIVTTDWLYLAWERVQAPNGTTNMDFELNQSSTVSANGVTHVRTEGDILIKYDLAKGGTTPVLGFHRWMTATGAACEKNGKKPPCWGPVQTLSAVQGVIGEINHVPVDDPINPGATRTLDSLTFGEARIDMETAGIFQPGVCVLFGSAYLKSRSSDAFAAEIKDFIAPIDIMVTNCAPKNLDNRAWARAANYAPPGGSLNDWFSDTGQIHVSDAGSVGGFLLNSPARRHLATVDGAGVDVEAGTRSVGNRADMDRRGSMLGGRQPAGTPWPREASDPNVAGSVPMNNVVTRLRLLS